MKDTASKFLNILQNMDSDFQLRMAVYILFAAACIVIGLLLWLLLRGIRLWYWKVDIQLDRLKDIDRNLTELRNDLKAWPAAAALCGQKVGESDGRSRESKQIQEDMKEQGPEINQKNICVSRNGRMYTEEELDTQIKD